jgi:dipeptidase E
MRLYLSSFRLGASPEHLVALLDPALPVAVIANAIDEDPDGRRPGGVRAEIEALNGLGLDAAELDLREYFQAPGEVAAALQLFGALWVRGGNAFVLRHSMRLSGADDAIRGLLARDALVYAGYSAGPCVLAPTLHGLELCDDPDAVPRLYDSAVVWDGLGVLDYAFVPHIDSPGHPETGLVAAVARRYRETGVAHRTLRDGQAIIVDADRTWMV